MISKNFFKLEYDFYGGKYQRTRFRARFLPGGKYQNNMI
jgi:hypothetical protein